MAQQAGTGIHLVLARNTRTSPACSYLHRRRCIGPLPLPRPRYRPHPHLRSPSSSHFGTFAQQICIYGRNFSGGYRSDRQGQGEAAQAIGMRPSAAMRWIILPQAARIVMPPLGNEVTLMIKSTSLLAVIGVRELFGTLQSLNAATFRTFELFAIAAIWYLLLTSITALLQRLIEHRLARQDWPMEVKATSIVSETRR
ncbi:ABC transporter permease subunit [Ensifer psoraleae]|uniref:ABC transporter permease subunit n=1 Tax=Sinorhizobium psoraleae TaxID=520838 RepID=A0ABT4K9P8_9HYPH|nr:ABC transporter permease subunit [Sinorhizobium psoraleae]MCZ4088622.1 ABC transporter permease subunit [Sinorhizobium psoraleae]